MTRDRDRINPGVFSSNTDDWSTKVHNGGGPDGQ